MASYKECPFCGSSRIEPANDGERFVSCLGCGAFGPDYGNADQELLQIAEGARQLWNQRVKPGEEVKPVRYNPPVNVCWWEVYDPDVNIYALEPGDDK